MTVRKIKGLCLNKIRVWILTFLSWLKYIGFVFDTFTNKSYFKIQFSGDHIEEYISCIYGTRNKLSYWNIFFKLKKIEFDYLFFLIELFKIDKTKEFS